MSFLLKILLIFLLLRKVGNFFIGKESLIFVIFLGLLYWKQQHLESACYDKLRKTENVSLVPPDISMPSSSSAYQSPCVKETVLGKLNSRYLISCLKIVFYPILDPEEPERMTKEEEEAKKFLEEEFEWFLGEYSNCLPNSGHTIHTSQPRMPKFSSDDNIRDDKLRENKTMPCLKFQVRSI